MNPAVTGVTANGAVQTEPLVRIHEKYAVTYDHNTGHVLVNYRGNVYDVDNGFRSIKTGRAMSADHRKIIEETGLIESIRDGIQDMVADRIIDSVAEKATTEATKFMDGVTTHLTEIMDKSYEEVLTAVRTVSDGIDGEVAKATEHLKENIDAYIESEYGNLPKRVEIVIGEESREIAGILHNKLPDVIEYIEHGVPVFMVGPAGTGKNVIAKQVAEATGRNFYFANAVTDEYRITGFIDANGTYHETDFYRAMKDGGLFFLDEMDASIPEVLVTLNAVIANGYFAFPIGMVDAHEDFRIIAAGNTYGTGASAEYTGRYQLDAASLNRFVSVTIDYDEGIEVELSRGDTQLLEFVRRYREAMNSIHLKSVASYRTIDMCSKMSKIKELPTLLKEVLLRGLSEDDLYLIVKAMSKGANSGGRSYTEEIDFSDIRSPFNGNNCWWEALMTVAQGE